MTVTHPPAARRPARIMPIAVAVASLLHANTASHSAAETASPPSAAAAADYPILTPKPGLEPRLHGPTIYGCRPGHPFLYRIPATGRRPMDFSADVLPGGLKLDAATGIITGAVGEKGTYRVILHASNQLGASERLFRIVCGDTLALTPPMGWNDWYAHYERITDKMVREAAEIMAKNGMADVGYQYVNIDDCWTNSVKNGKPGRDGEQRDSHGNILPNSRFPDMKALVDYVHAKGLKAGIYSSPGPRTCGGFVGCLGHEEADARQFAAWGFDFLKYDLCSYGEMLRSEPQRLASLQEPYRLMGRLLRQQDRDIVFNLCEYGMGDVWEWGEAIGGHSWRTGGDLGFELDNIFGVALANIAHRTWSKPGSWNDPDYIQIGYIGNAREEGLPQRTRMPANKQYAYMSLWCLIASPLIYSGDLSQLDDFTLNVLCNPEVIDVDQDALGQCARLVQSAGDTFILIKDLEDGSKAVGFCNAGKVDAVLVARWSELGIGANQRVRDLWRQRDLGSYGDQFQATVPASAVTLLRVSPIRGPL